jgi:DNA invertase Pin-like site-specific DNA recombinase
MKHVAIYMRVSTKGNQTTASQEPDLQRWVGNQDAPVVFYTDKTTGKNMDRPGWAKLEAAMRAGKVSAIVVWRIDRLGRTAKGLTALFDEVQERGVGLVSLKEGIDLGTPAGRLMANVIASVAQYETEVRGERVLAGQAAARAKGKTWGGSVAGVRKVVTPEQCKSILHLASLNTPITRIAKTVGLSRPTIRSVLKEEVAA